MNTVDIIKQQRKINDDKLNAEKKLAYDTIKEWIEENADDISHQILSTITKKFIEWPIDSVKFRCVSSNTGYPLGEDYPNEIGLAWCVYYTKDNSETQGSLPDSEEIFFRGHQVGKNDYTIRTFRLFISQLVICTALPELLRKEGFEVRQKGEGCNSTITARLPETE